MPALGFRRHRKAHDQKIDHRAEYEQAAARAAPPQQGIDGEEREQEGSRIHRDHQEFAMAKITATSISQKRSRDADREPPARSQP